jgi:hypothetical protein
MKNVAAWLVLTFALFGAGGCRNDIPTKNWIQGNDNERWTAVAKHLRGLDVAMVEIGYRYQELYWGGIDGNWEYADYQLTKMKLTLKNALERRPKRRASAEELFFSPLTEMSREVSAKEHDGFEKAFAGLTEACNACHVAEDVASFRVAAPSDRPSPIRAP